MSKFPSISAAIVTGALWMPFFIWSMKFVETKAESQGLLVLWFLLGFCLPVLVSIGDFRYIRRRMEAEATFFRKIRMNWARPEDFKEFFVPAWIRMGVLFLSAIVSIMFIKAVGIKI